MAQSQSVSIGQVGNETQKSTFLQIAPLIQTQILINLIDVFPQLNKAAILRWEEGPKRNCFKLERWLL